MRLSSIVSFFVRKRDCHEIATPSVRCFGIERYLKSCHIYIPSKSRSAEDETISTNLRHILDRLLPTDDQSVVICIAVDFWTRFLVSH